jgi:beta-barrel assembly-enhancing protease
MNARLLPILCLLALLSGCKGAEIVGGIARDMGVNIGGVPVSDYAESAVKSGAAVSRSMEDFTPEQEYYIGRAVTASLLGTYRPLNNQAANDYVNALGQALALFSDMPLTYGGYHFQIVDSLDINAFAAPGGFILVTRGLIRCCPNETALAAVLAHEIAHVQHRDALRAIKKSRMTEALGIIGGEAIKHAGGAELNQLTGIFADSVGDVMTTMVNNGYSRAYEYEADQAALGILHRAGYDPSGLALMLRGMNSRLVSGRADFAKTHPAPVERIKKLTGLNADAMDQEPLSRETRFRKAVASL